MRPSTASIQALILALVMAGAASQVTGQAGTGQTVIQKATEQFENSPLKTTALGQGLFVFSGDGGDVTAIVDNGSTLIIDSGVDTRVTELSDAIFKATMRPVTRLVNTHWHFDHTGGNVFFGSAGVTIIAQENVKKRLPSVQSVPFVGLRDVHCPHGAQPTRANLEEYRDMLVQVRQRIVDLIAAGKTIDEAVAAAPTKQFDAKWGSGYVPPNVFTKMVFSSLTYGGSTGR